MSNFEVLLHHQHRIFCSDLLLNELSLSQENRFRRADKALPNSRRSTLRLTNVCMPDNVIESPSILVRATAMQAGPCPMLGMCFGAGRRIGENFAMTECWKEIFLVLHVA